jgi:hypothetical protein
MALSWFDACYCGLGPGTGEAVATTLCDADSDGSPDLCAAGDLQACRDLVAAYTLTWPGAEGVDLVAVSLYVTKAGSAVDIGVKGTILSIIDDQALYWEASASLSISAGALPTFVIGGRLLTPWKGVAGVSGLDINEAALYVGFKPGFPGFAFFNVRTDLRIGPNTNIAGELYFDARKGLPKVLVKVEANQFTMLSLLEFVELRTNTTISKHLPEFLVDKFRAMGWFYIKLLAVSQNIEITYPPNPLCAACSGGGGVVKYLGPQLDLELRDSFWGGTRDLKVKFLVGKELVPEFPYMDFQWDRTIRNAKFFNNIANKLKFGGAIAKWLAGGVNSLCRGQCDDVVDGIEDVGDTFDAASEKLKKLIQIHHMEEKGFHLIGFLKHGKPARVRGNATIFGNYVRGPRPCVCARSHLTTAAAAVRVGRNVHQKGTVCGGGHVRKKDYRYHR